VKERGIGLWVSWGIESGTATQLFKPKHDERRDMMVSREKEEGVPWKCIGLSDFAY